MKNKILYILIFLLAGSSITELQAQSYEIKTSYLQGVATNTETGLYHGGVELGAKYLYPKKQYVFSGGLNFRTVQWGNQLTMSLGAEQEMFQRMWLYAEVQNGIALFVDKPLYVGSTEIGLSYMFYTWNRGAISLSLGTRYTICPAYRNYSTIYQLVEVPVGVRVWF